MNKVNKVIECFKGPFSFWWGTSLPKYHIANKAIKLHCFIKRKIKFDIDLLIINSFLGIENFIIGTRLKKKVSFLMIIITRVINIIGKLSTHKRHTVIPCVCKRMLIIKKKGGGG